MGEKTTIAWCHKTFNPVLGCTKIVDACKNCYAETYAERWGLAKWGVHGTRYITSDNNWNKPLQWQKQAEKEGVRYRVFCASLSDVMEDHLTWNQVRPRLWKLIEGTPNLDWMLLTKRPNNFRRFFPERWLSKETPFHHFPRNIWLGATIANQKDYNGFMPPLSSFCKEYDVTVMFMSAEPLLGMIDFEPEVLNMNNFLCLIGGESGFITKIRKLDLYHVKRLIDQLKQHPNTKIFFKQLGSILAKEYKLRDKKGEHFDEYPELLDWLKIRQMPFYEQEFSTI